VHRSEARLKQRHRKSIVMLSSRSSEFDLRSASEVPPSTIAHQHHHHHQMSSNSVSVPSSYLTSTDSADLDVGYSSVGYGNGFCAAAAASDHHLFQLPVLDCACADTRFRPRCCDNVNGLAQCQQESPSLRLEHMDFSSFKDIAATDHLLRMPNAAILLPVADSAVNYGLEDVTRTSLRAVDVCQSCSTDSTIT